MEGSRRSQDEAFRHLRKNRGVIRLKSGKMEIKLRNGLIFPQRFAGRLCLSAKTIETRKGRRKTKRSTAFSGHALSNRANKDKMKSKQQPDKELHIRKKVAGGTAGAVLGAAVGGPIGAIV